MKSQRQATSKNSLILLKIVQACSRVKDLAVDTSYCDELIRRLGTDRVRIERGPGYYYLEYAF